MKKYKAQNIKHDPHVTITACILAKNEQDKISDCIDSVVWCDEVILIDTGSSDMTVEIAKKAKIKVVEFSKGSFDEWRNEGRRRAKGDWLLYLDADERVTPKLQNEIKTLITSHQSQHYTYAIPRKNIIFGKHFRFGGEYPDFQKRLFMKDSLVTWSGKVHEQPIFKGDLGYLKNDLLHLKHNDLTSMVAKTNVWSEIEARLMFDANHPPMTIARFMTAVGREFWDRMIRKQGFRDGPKGIIYSLYQVFSRFVSYAKLWEMQEENK